MHEISCYGPLRYNDMMNFLQELLTMGSIIEGTWIVCHNFNISTNQKMNYNGNIRESMRLEELAHSIHQSKARNPPALIKDKPEKSF